MIVVADTSPLNYLIQIEKESLLAALYKTVIIPEAVIAELKHAAAAPRAVHEWLLQCWVRLGLGSILCLWAAAGKAVSDGG